MKYVIANHIAWKQIF